MRLTALILTACCLSAAAGTKSQSNITYFGKNVKLEKVFQAVKQQTGYIFFYDNATLAKSKPVTIDAKNLPLAEFMELVLRGQELTWLLENTTILIQKKKEESIQPVNSVDQIIVTGTILGPDKEPLPGVNIVVKGTRNGTSTDARGEFTLKNVDVNAVLIISATNIETREIRVNGKTNLSNINVKIKVAELNEVVVNKGYYTERQKVSTSNVATVKAVDIEKQPVQNPLLALQGRVPGLFVTQPSGLSGTGVKVRIQGENSIRNGNEPLFVVDGVPIESKISSTGIDNSIATFDTRGGSPLNYINPLDIESIEVLKDADATAIYGTRAANGAILITTKKGKAGAMRLDLNMQTGWGKMTRRVDMMNTRQYLDMRYEAFRNDNINWRDKSVSADDLKVWDTTSYHNWQDELLSGTSHYSDVNAGVSGGTATMRYLVSGTYHKETTIFPFPEFNDQKAAVHFNLNANSANQKLSMQFTGNYLHDENKLPRFDLTQAALLKEPHSPPLLNADGSINWAPDADGNSTMGTTQSNVMIQRLKKYENRTYNLVSNLKLDYNLLPDFNMAASVGYNLMQTNDYLPEPLIAVAPELRATTQRSAAFGNRHMESWIAQSQLNYSKAVGKGTLAVNVGSELQNRTEQGGNIIAKGQLSDDMLDNINAASTILNGRGPSSEYKYLAFFGRANYNYRDKYIVNINARRDGSSRFGPDNRFQNFGSVGAAWIVSGENFFKPYADIVNFAKLRGSYGTTGSDQIGDYQYLSLYNVITVAVPYQGIAGLARAGIPNPKLQWEQTRKLQVGMDVGIFNDRLVINATFVRNRCSNQLLAYPLPSQTGNGAYNTNLPATIQNQNWEFVLTAKPVQTKDVVWTSSFNLAIERNELIRFPDLANSAYAGTLHLGASMDVFGYPRWLGVATGTGDYLYADKKGNPTLTPKFEDRTVLISLYPKFYGGFENTVSYKNLQLSFVFQLVKQTGFDNGAAYNGFPIQMPGMFGAGLSNQPARLMDRWQQPGDNNKSVAKYSTSRASRENVVGGDLTLADASYIRLKNISLSWEVPEKWLDKARIRNLQLYVHGQNLITITNYKGLDPETQSLSVLPPLQLCTVGIKLSI